MFGFSYLSFVSRFVCFAFLIFLVGMFGFSYLSFALFHLCFAFPSFAFTLALLRISSFTFFFVFLSLFSFQSLISAKGTTLSRDCRCTPCAGAYKKGLPLFLTSRS